MRLEAKINAGHVRVRPARLIATLLALLPVLMLAWVVFSLVGTALQGVRQWGLAAFFSTRISNESSVYYVPGQVGLLPAAWGTLMVAVLTMATAIPVSLAMAVFASEFSLGGVGRAMEAVLALFAGIPAVLYALLSIFVARSFIQPMFAGAGLSVDEIKSLPGLPPYNPFMLPWTQCVLLGAILISLLVIPFVAPLMLDAIRNVPAGQREASLALGATRWHTLRRVTLPMALPGISTAASLGLLKAIGDVIISIWTIGQIHDGMPAPLWDVFERVAPLTATGAGFMGGITGQGTPQPNPAAYFAGLLLLVIAVAVLCLANTLQWYLRRRLSL
jgi:phosphate transport system permease protein